MNRDLGPLAGLEGVWEGDHGKDSAPNPGRTGSATSDYRERMVFAPTGLVENHEQRLFGLRYSTTAWRLGADEPFHEELGYWLWDGGTSQAMRCFMVPRGVTILAGGTTTADATSFELAAELGSPTYGICSNPFLDEKFKTVRYELKLELRDPGTLHYWEDTVLQMPEVSELFHHTDENTLTKVS